MPVLLRHSGGTMSVTKHYLYTLRFERGSVEVRDKPLVEALSQLVVRTTCIPGHRIIIKAHEDPADPCEVGAALRRLEALRHHLVGQSIEEQRIELQVHGKEYPFQSEKAPRLPRVTSYNGAISEAKQLAVDDVVIRNLKV